MSQWRVIIMDPEAPTGVAPICNPGSGHGPTEVEPCCPGPYLECYDPKTAVNIAGILSLFDIGVCE